MSWWGLRMGLLCALALSAVEARAQFASIERLESVPPDATPAQVLEQLEAAPQADRLSLNPPDTGVHWWRLKPDDSVRSLRDPVLVIRSPRLSRETVFVPPDYAPQQRSMYSREEKEPFSRHALVVRLPPGLERPLLVRMEGARTLPQRVEIMERDAYQSEDLGYVRRFGAVYTVLGLIALVGFTFWMRLRDPVYLWFVAYVLGHLLYFLSSNGDVYDLPVLGPYFLAVPYGVPVGANIAVVAGIHFAQRFARLPRYVPWISRALWSGAAVGWFLTAVAALPLPFDRAWLPVAGNALVLAYYPLLFLGPLLAWWRGSRAAGLFLLAWTPLLLATFGLVLSIFGRSAPAWAVEMVLPVCACLTSLLLVIVLAERMLRLRRERDVASIESQRDPLTGALNRRGFEARLGLVHADAVRQRMTYAVLFADLDHFKRVNDGFGHAIGDRCLVTLVARLQTELRQGDALGRFGGEEFVVLLPGAGIEQARSIAERMRADLERDGSVVDGQPVRLTASFGLAVFDPDVPCRPETLLERADAALYRAKHSGRNRVVSAHDEPVPAAMAPSAPGVGAADPGL